MSIAVKEYDAKIDAKKRITLRNSLFEYYHVEEYSDGRIILECSEDDFNTVLCLCETLLYHSIHIYLKLQPKTSCNVLPDIESGVNARRYALYHKLPDEFDKSIYDRIVSEMNENVSTASKWIDKFIQDKRLKRTSKGYYQKINNV